MDIMKLANELLLDPFRLGADGKTASALENSNAIQPATELAASGASELHSHQWLRPDNGCIECATCGATRNHYGD